MQIREAVPLEEQGSTVLVGSRTTPTLMELYPDAEESIEIDDRTMLEALLKVKKEISQSAPHPGKLRLILAIALITILSILSLFLGPQAITSYAGKILPNTKQLQLSEEIEQRIGQLAGPYCETPEGKSAAQKLIERLKIKNLTKIF